jgi:hypothetical protein
MKRPMIISSDVIGEVENLKYLGSFVPKDGTLIWMYINGIIREDRIRNEYVRGSIVVGMW